MTYHRPTTISRRIFGSDGIRGAFGVFPLTDNLILRIGKAAALFLSIKNRRNGSNHKIVIGKDTRQNAGKLEEILIRGINCYGTDVILSGVISTPGLAFLVKHLKADMGIMISASCNQAEDNGLKFFSRSGYKLAAAYETEIEKLVFNGLTSYPRMHTQGAIATLEDSPGLYLDFLKSKFPGLKSCSGLKLVVDCAYGALSHIAPALFKEIGLQVQAMNDSPDGNNINLNCGALYPQDMAKAVTEYNADVGFSYDSDGDKVILSDEKGNLLDGDHIMAIIGLYLSKMNRLPKNSLVATVMSNYGLQETLENAGLRLVRTDVGDRNVTEAMLRDGMVFGGEQSGHIIFLNHSTTGDALITSLEILKIMDETNHTLSEISQCMRKSPQVLVNVRVKEKKPFDELPRLKEAILNSESRIAGNGRLLVRYSGTEPLARIMVEGIDQDLIEDIADSLAMQIRQEIGTEGD